ncbi:hypothetical protein RRG08_065479 [Elysia crispata]|uniref:Uncharacterized protein n=1 Tax=Elysia crispata TaxID=231223 RepID=A0AAE1E2U7_9GAST|nr:hypothetical protein RRG08_065479 [Elysia crispata]
MRLCRTYKIREHQRMFSTHQQSAMVGSQFMDVSEPGIEPNTYLQHRVSNLESNPTLIYSTVSRTWNRTQHLSTAPCLEPGIEPNTYLQHRVSNLESNPTLIYITVSPNLESNPTLIYSTVSPNLESNPTLIYITVSPNLESNTTLIYITAAAMTAACLKPCTAYHLSGKLMVSRKRYDRI